VGVGGGFTAFATEDAAIDLLAAVVGDEPALAVAGSEEILRHARAATLHIDDQVTAAGLVPLGLLPVLGAGSGGGSPPEWRPYQQAAAEGDHDATPCRALPEGPGKTIKLLDIHQWSPLRAAIMIERRDSIATME
jgi:hypothetical protein